MLEQIQIGDQTPYQDPALTNQGHCPTLQEISSSSSIVMKPPVADGAAAELDPTSAIDKSHDLTFSGQPLPVTSDTTAVVADSNLVDIDHQSMRATDICFNAQFESAGDDEVK